MVESVSICRPGVPTMRQGRQQPLAPSCGKRCYGRRKIRKMHANVERFQLKYNRKEQVAQLSQRDRAAGRVTVMAKSGRLELGDNIYVY